MFDGAMKMIHLSTCLFIKKILGDGQSFNSNHLKKTFIKMIIIFIISTHNCIP